MENLTKAQTRDAETQARRSRQSLQQSVRSAWVHILYPDPPGKGDGNTGYVLRSTRLTNRGGAKPIPEAVWDKAGADGTVLDKLGPGNLAKRTERSMARGTIALGDCGHPGLVRLLCLSATAP